MDFKRLYCKPYSRPNQVITTVMKCVRDYFLFLFSTEILRGAKKISQVR